MVVGAATEFVFDAVAVAAAGGGVGCVDGGCGGGAFVAAVVAVAVAVAVALASVICGRFGQSPSTPLCLLKHVIEQLISNQSAPNTSVE